MSIHARCEALSREAEKLLRDADDDVATATPTAKIARRRRNAINAACNALYRAMQAN